MVKKYLNKPMSQKIITLAELRQRYDAGERDFTGVKLQTGILKRIRNLPRGIILKKADLSETEMDGIGIYDVDLSYANLRKTNLGETGFGQTNLEGTDFRGADFCQTLFSNCNLRHANFAGTDLVELLFRDCDLSYANFKDTTQFDIGRCKGVIFHETIMPDGSLLS